MKLIQITLHSSFHGTKTLMGLMGDKQINIGPLQDFHQNKNTVKITGFNKGNSKITIKIYEE